MSTENTRFQFRLSQMLLIVCLIAMLLGAYRVHPALAIIVAYCVALCSVGRWPAPARVMFIAMTLIAAVTAALQDAWPVAGVLVIFVLAIIEGPISKR